MEIMEKKDNQIIFSAEMDESLANAIRRYINQIPTLAVDEVEISKNDSPLYDETIAHRIGLIPLQTKDSKKDGTLKLTSKKEGSVYSGELEGDVKIVYDSIPITVLTKGQEISLVATAKKGTGKEHSKYSPGAMFYRNQIDVQVEKDCPEEVVKSCPKGIITRVDGKIKVDNAISCDMCEVCLETSKKAGKEFVKLKPTKNLIITLESFGQLEMKDIFKKSADILKKDLADIAKKIK